MRACNAGARLRGGPDFKEKSGSDATEYIIDSFLSTYARLKSRSGLRVNLSVPETDSLCARRARRAFAARTRPPVLVRVYLPVDLSTVDLRFRLLSFFSSFSSGKWIGDYRGSLSRP